MNDKIGPVRKMIEHIANLEALVQTLRNDYLRALADFDNFRKRMDREMEERQRAKVEELFIDLIPVLDNFERALTGNEQRNIEGLRKGIDLIYKQLCDVLGKYGLKGYSCLGEEFDPHFAEAIGYVEKEGVTGNQVVEEWSRGYKCGGKVLRPARVVVAKEVIKKEGDVCEDKIIEISQDGKESNNSEEKGGNGE